MRDILINNAGVSAGAVIDGGDDQWRYERASDLSGGIDYFGVLKAARTRDPSSGETGAPAASCFASTTQGAIGRTRADHADAGHFPASGGGSATGFSAFTTVIHVVFGAFRRAGVADFRAERANFLGEFSAPRHFVRGKGAGIRAATVKLDASREHLHLVFLQAGARAVLAGGNTILAGINAALIFFVGHMGILLGW